MTSHSLDSLTWLLGLALRHSIDRASRLQLLRSQTQLVKAAPTHSALLRPVPRMSTRTFFLNFGCPALILSPPGPLQLTRPYFALGPGCRLGPHFLNFGCPTLILSPLEAVPAHSTPLRPGPRTSIGTSLLELWVPNIDFITPEAVPTHSALLRSGPRMATRTSLFELWVPNIDFITPRGRSSSLDPTSPWAQDVDWDITFGTLGAQH